MVRSRKVIISSLHELYRELLEAVGILDDNALAVAGVHELIHELERANRMLGIVEEIPSPEIVTEWIEAAAAQVGIEVMPEREVLMPVNYEGNPQVASMIDDSPVAIPLPGRLLVENQLAVADIPVGILLNKYAGDLDVRITANESERQESSSPIKTRGGTHIQKAELPGTAATKLEVDTLRLKPIHHYAREEGVMKLPVFSTETDGEEVILRAPLEKTNRGRNPNSRFFVRGVLHSHPGRIVVGAIVTLALITVIPLGITAAVLLMVARGHEDQYPWVGPWMLAFPLSVFALGVFYWWLGYPCRCRICTHRLFTPQRFLKNIKAHHLPGIGYIIPLIFHLLIFRWFRCTHCGTPVRLKR